MFTDWYHPGQRRGVKLGQRSSGASQNTPREWRYPQRPEPHQATVSPSSPCYWHQILNHEDKLPCPSFLPLNPLFRILLPRFSKLFSKQGVFFQSFPKYSKSLGIFFLNAFCSHTTISEMRWPLLHAGLLIRQRCLFIKDWYFKWCPPYHLNRLFPEMLNTVFLNRLSKQRSCIFLLKLGYPLKELERAFYFSGLTEHILFKCIIKHRAISSAQPNSRYSARITTFCWSALHNHN